MIEFISQLPTEYQEVEYIESSGTQHIDTGFMPNQDTRVVCDIDYTLTAATAWLFGARTSNEVKTYNVLTYSSKYRSDYNNKTTDCISHVNPTGRFVLDKNKNITYFDNVVGVSMTYAAFQCDYTLYLFANNEAGTAAKHGTFKLFSCCVYDNGTLVRDFVPCYRKVDNVAGLYDLVNNVFYTNAGSGVFAVGADSNKHATATIIPGGVIPMQYALRRRMMAGTGGLFPPIGTPLSDWTWEQIVELANSGKNPQNYFSVGDEKDLILTTGEVVPVVIGDFYHNTITGTSTKAPIAFTFKNCLNTTYSMNNSNTNSGGWDGSAMRNTHMPAILNTFPAELIADGAIKYVDVLASAGSQSTSLVTSSDRLRLHSIAELGLSDPYAASGEGTKYAYYTSGNRVKTVGGAASIYWTRSPYTDWTRTFCCVDRYGAANSGSASNSNGVACGFDI